ncbi:aminotransferase-like domain-containing protein [Streptomyces sp. NBC_01262]|uniref:aminotransferase-like domain-containing protein n=1 Tax=Streptomyces sp. NBC_01262 TaxID=2903803 RepID=UPI002E37F337|nr:PLP-dependent aminotransferase family protein [Streptomyces sp. NBC_01262]
MPTSPALSELLARRTGLAKSDAIRDILAAAAAPGILSMAGGLPAPDSFPVAELAQAAAELLAKSPAVALQYAPTEGIPAMREAVATRAGETGAGTTVDRVLITSGSQQGLSLIADVLLEENDIVVLDDPSYLGAVQTFQRAGAQLLPVPGDREGMRTDVLADRLAAGTRCKLVYVIPHFHNPTGAVLSTPRRRQLAGLAERYGFVVVEDDPYADLSFDGMRLPSMDVHTDRVIRLMSLSKTVCPGLRVSGLTGPRRLVTELASAKQCADLQTNTFGQHMLARLLTDPGFLPDHVDRLRHFYRTKADQLATLLSERLSWLAFEPPRGGLFFWCSITEPLVCSDDLAMAALASGVAIVPGSPFCVERDGSYDLRLSYATLTHEMREAVDRLSAAFRKSRLNSSYFHRSSF